MTRLLMLSIATAVAALAGAAATPAEPSTNANCVADFTTAAAAAGAAGDVISQGAHLLQPFGQNVASFQAHSEQLLGHCAFTFPL
jgi:hypothetical protein